MNIIELHSKYCIKEESEQEITLSDIHILKIIRNGRKCWTIVEGLEFMTDVNTICKILKKVCKCGGSVGLNRETNEKFVQLQGDHVDKVKNNFLNNNFVSEDKIKCHG